MVSQAQAEQQFAIDELPNLPLTCLETAEFTNTIDAFRGKNTVIDFWTTKCTRCPSALDTLHTLSLQPRYAPISFVSICCDSCDGARNIIEHSSEPRWNNIHHYYMDTPSKEIAKKVLGFAMVPFYVVLNQEGKIVMKGSKKVVDFEKVPSMLLEKEEEEIVPVVTMTSMPEPFGIKHEPAPVLVEQDSEEEVSDGGMSSGNDSPLKKVKVDRVFAMDDDF